MTSTPVLRSVIVSLALIAGAAQAADPQGSQPQPLTRAEVVADLHLWQRAGVERLQAIPGHNVYAADYQHAVADYQALRAGSAYAEEVTRVRAGQRSR